MKLDLGFLDIILKYVPTISKPTTPLSFREKLKWTAVIMGIYFLMFSTPAFGVSASTLSQSQSLINVIFASRVGMLVTVGIGPIVMASIILQLVMGSGILNMDLNDPEQKSRYQSIQKSAAMVIAFAEAYIYVASGGGIGLLGPSFFWLVVLQLALAAIFIIFLDEAMTKYGITSGINLFIAGGVAYSLISGSWIILSQNVPQALASGGATAIPNALIEFAPMIFAVIVFLVCIYIYDVKVEVPLVFSQMRGVGGRLPIPLLYLSVIPVILATSLIVALGLWLSFLANVSGPLAAVAKFIAFYSPQVAGGITRNVLSGGLLYLISPIGFGGTGSYALYISTLTAGSSSLYLPWGGVVQVPEFIHSIIYTITLICFSVLFGTFWIEMTGQSPKNVADQLEGVGWQVPGFRRDPRIVEGILNKYIPTIAMLGSIFVALLASLATLTGAVGTGTGILLTVGIMYMVYQQLERENALAQYSQLNKLLS